MVNKNHYLYKANICYVYFLHGFNLDDTVHHEGNANARPPPPPPPNHHPHTRTQRVSDQHPPPPHPREAARAPIVLDTRGHAKLASASQRAHAPRCVATRGYAMPHEGCRIVDCRSSVKAWVFLCRPQRNSRLRTPRPRAVRALGESRNL